MRHRLRDGRQRRPNTCTGKPPDQKMVSREKKGMKRDMPDTAIIPVVQSFLVSEKIKSAGLAPQLSLRQFKKTYYWTVRLRDLC